MRFIVFVAVVFCLVSNASLAEAKGKKEVKKGNVLYNKGKFEEALKQYEEAFLHLPDSDVVNFNLGAALYKTKDYRAAMNHFERSLVSSDQLLEEKASYNIGNAKYKYGIGKEESDLDGAIKLLEGALKNYEHAIGLDPDDKDAKHNYEFVKKELERLKKKRKNQKENKKENKKNKEGKGGGKAEKKKPEKKPEAGKKSPQKKQEQEGEKKKENKNPENKQKAEEGQEKGKPRSKEEKGSAPPGQGKPEEMSKKEASMLLENYRQEEEPKTLYKEKVPAVGLPEVLKDW